MINGFLPKVVPFPVFYILSYLHPAILIADKKGKDANIWRII